MSRKGDPNISIPRKCRKMPPDHSSCLQLCRSVPCLLIAYAWQFESLVTALLTYLIVCRALAKSNKYIGKRYVEVFESKSGEMEWTCKRMGQPQEKGNESVVRLRGLPFEVSKEEIAQFFTGKSTLSVSCCKILL